MVPILFTLVWLVCMEPKHQSGITECDLLITIGARFSDRVTGNAKICQKAKFFILM